MLATTRDYLNGPQKASLLEGKSYRHQRVLRSTLAAEAASLDRAHDMGNFMACVFSNDLWLLPRHHWHSHVYL